MKVRSTLNHESSFTIICKRSTPRQVKYGENFSGASACSIR